MYVSMLGDCNDANPFISPLASEVCNGIDDDCDMTTDDGVAAMCSPAINSDYVGICEPPPATAGQCACAVTGLADCNRSPADGCEVDTRDSWQDCGSCGNVCGPSDGCAAGTCGFAAIQRLDKAAYASCVVRDRNVFACWGSAGQNLFETALPSRRPTAERIGRDFEILEYSSGGAAESSMHHCIIVQTPSGRDIYCWGVDYAGQLGRGASGPTATNPTRIAASVDDVVNDWAQIAVQSAVTFARTTSGFVYSWGQNTSGQLGRGGADALPAPVMLITDATDIDVAFSHGCAVRSGGGGQAWCWGSDSFDRSGDGTPFRNGPTPEPVLTFSGGMEVPLLNVVEVTTRADGGCARTATNQVWCWGAGDAVGTGTARTGLAELVTGAPNASEVECEDAHCCAILAGGSVRCWGAGGGRLGDGTTLNRNMPVDVVLAGGGPLLGVSDLSLGRVTTCGLVRMSPTDHRVVCWGGGGEGQLGTGGYANRLHAGAPDWVMGL
jgi:alpha-tubulin suppressor-like RCC1 family protein